MVKLWKYYLSLWVLVVYPSCIEKNNNTTQTERRQLAEKVLNEALEHYQGTPKYMQLTEKATLIDSTYAEAFRELSIAYLKRGIPHKWKPLIDKAVYHDPKSWLSTRGTTYLLSFRNYEKALEDLHAADSLTPNFTDYTGGHSINYWKGIAYLGSNDLKNAIKYFDKHIKKETEETGEDWVELDAFLYRGIAQYEIGNTNAAKQDFDKMLHHFKNSADANYYISKILKEKGKTDSAKIYIKQAKKDFKLGYYNYRPYVEVQRQIYWDDLDYLENSLRN